ncbi:MAG: cation-translocating P-type ATPase [Anaerolineae bacterium]
MNATSKSVSTTTPAPITAANSAGDSLYSQPVESAVQRLETHLESGLTDAQVRQRLAAYGHNELPAASRTPLWRLFVDQFKDFVVLLLIVASVVSALLGDTIEAIAIMAIVILNAVIGLVQERKADQALEALKKMAAPDAFVLRDGRRVKVPARELVPGDIVFLEAGNYVPADIRLAESFNLQINESALTGESEPVTKRADQVIAAGAPISDRLNTAFSSTVVTYGRGKGIVTATGQRTEIGMIARMLGEIEEESTPLQKRLNQLGKTLSVIALALCALVFVTQVTRNTDLGLIFTQGFVAYLAAYSKAITDFFILAVSLAVAAVPEGLAAVVTINLALGMREMVKRNALIRRLSAVETLGSTTVICTDKTGTLTQNAMNVARIVAGGREYAVTGERYEPKGEIRELGARKPSSAGAGLAPDVIALLRGALLCNDAVLEASGMHDDQPTWRMVGDPTEGALVVAAARAGLWRNDAEALMPRIAEAPFDADRKMMTTVHRDRNSATLIAYTKGAPDIVLSRCSHWLVEGEAKPLTEADRRMWLEKNTALAADALRVLAVATRTITEAELQQAQDAGAGPALANIAERDMTFVGLLGMIDPPRPEVIPAIQQAKEAGIRTIMITGDYAMTARAIARQIGLLTDDGHQAAGDGQAQSAPRNADVVTGAEIEAMSDDALRECVNTASVFARVAPEHKVRIVTAVRRNGHVAAMTGDGVNDAPALKRADIGVAMGITGTDVSKETADMVLTDDNYASIVSAVEQGRIIYSNIRKFVFYLLGCNVAEIFIILGATLAGLRSPLTAIQLLWLNLMTDGAPALALGLEKGDPDVMKVPPRPAKEPIINRRMVLGMATQTVALMGAVLGIYAIALQMFPAQAETMAFAALAFAELPLAYTSRSERYSIVRIGVFSNRAMQWAVLASIAGLLAVIYIPFLNPVFNTTPLTPQQWALLLPAIFAPALVAEITKAVARKKGWR